MLGLMAMNVLSIVAISYSTDPNIYFAANALQALTNLSSLVFQLGLAAAVDRSSGRVFAAANGLVALGNGLGPAVAGALAGPFGAPNVAIAVVGFNSIAAALYLIVSVGVAQRSISLRG
jgi:hypothetical protein